MSKEKQGLTKSIQKLCIKNFSQHKVHILDDLLNHKANSSYYQIFQKRDFIKKQKKIINLYQYQKKNHINRMFQRNRSINNTPRKDKKTKDEYFKNLINCLKQSINKRSIQQMLRLFQQFRIKSQDTAMKLMCLLDQIVLIEYLGLSKQKIKKLIYLSDFLITLKKYQTSVEVLYVALAMSIALGMFNLELTIYDKLGVSYYYLQSLKISEQYHNYFASGKSIATDTIRASANTIIRDQIKQPFNEKFYQALSTPICNYDSRIPQIEEMLVKFMKRPDMQIIIKTLSIPVQPSIGKAVIKSHLSGLRHGKEGLLKRL